MVIRIQQTKQRFFDEHGQELSGCCYFPTPQRMFIRISRRHNKTVNVFAGTVLHELLHAWINILERKGFKSDAEKEEQFVVKVEKTVVRELNKKFRRK